MSDIKRIQMENKALKQKIKELETYIYQINRKMPVIETKMIIQSRGQKKQSNSQKNIYHYAVRAEFEYDISCAKDILFANNCGFIVDKIVQYEQSDGKPMSDRYMQFYSSCPISQIRKYLYDNGYELDLMVRTIDYVNDYTGECYFKKHWDDPISRSNYESDEEYNEHKKRK